MLGVSLVLAGLTTGNKIGLAAVAAAFIVFALVSSFVLPSRYPNFPGRHVGWYVALGLLFLVAMLSAVLVFGVEKEEEATPGESPARTETRSGSLPGQTTSTPEATTTETESEGSASGDAAAGKAVFASAGCGGCHVLKAAGASGNVGPNLDDLKPDAETVADQVEHGGGAMPAFKGQLSDKQIQDVAAFVASSTG